MMYWLTSVAQLMYWLTSFASYDVLVDLIHHYLSSILHSLAL